MDIIFFNVNLLNKLFPRDVLFVDQDELLFPTWNEIFESDGAPVDGNISIYSFDGRNVLTDSLWSVFTPNVCVQSRI